MMFGGGVLVKLALVLSGLAVVSATADVVSTSGQWAITLNTFLLVVLALLANRNHRTASRVEGAVQEVHESVDSAAMAASHAATAAADTARIVKEIGGHVRQGELQVQTTPAATGTTDTTGTKE